MRLITSGLLTFLVLSHAEPSWAGLPDATTYHALRLADGTCLDDQNINRTRGSACEEGPRERWKVTPTSNGYYTISPEDQGAKWCLGMVKDDGDVDNKARVKLRECEGDAPEQHWKLTAVGDLYSISNESRGDKNCLAIVDDAARLVGCANVDGQHWKFNRDPRRCRP